MKLFLLLFVVSIAMASFSYAKTTHTIEIRLFVVKKKEMLPLFDFQKMKSRGFEILAEGDPVLDKYKGKFKDIKSISIYVPEEKEKNDTVIIRFKNGETVISRVKSYMPFESIGKKRVFSEKNFAKLRLNHSKRLAQVNETDKLRWMKINY